MNDIFSKIQQILGKEGQNLLNYKSTTFDKNNFVFPDENMVEKVFLSSNRNPRVLSNLQRLYSSGRLANTGYLSILPVDQGVEHSAGARFSKNPMYFDPESIIKLGLEGGCSGVASTLGILGLTSRKYAHKIPFIVKINHNQTLTYPNEYDQIMFSDVEQAYNLGAAAIGATIFFGSKEANKQIIEVSRAFKRAHELGMATILWCYLRNPHFNVNGNNYHYSSDLTGQANYLGATIEADIIKQKPAKINGGYKVLNTLENSYGALNEDIYTKYTTNHPIDLTRYQLANCYMGKIPLINSGDPSGENDELEAIKSAVINKKAGGSGLIMGRKAFEKSFEDGIKILNLVQDVYLCKEIEIS